MRFSKYYFVRCENCYRESAKGKTTQKLTLKQARDDGWKQRKGKFLCPECLSK